MSLHDDPRHAAAMARQRAEREWGTLPLTELRCAACEDRTEHHFSGEGWQCSRCSMIFRPPQPSGGAR